MSAITRDIVVLGASAGGIEALGPLLAALPADLPAAVFVVLHIHPHGESRLQEVLARRTRLKVCRPRDGQRWESSTVYIAQPDLHLMLDGDHVRLTRGPKESRVRPCIDVLFRSAAYSHGPRVIGAVLSGTLDDGTAGLWAIQDRGGLCLVQDPAEAEFGSMPESAIEHVDGLKVGTIGELAAMIREFAGSTVMNTSPPPDEASRQRYAVEHTIALEGNGLKAGVLELGKQSRYTCPDCHGVLVQIEEGRITRFRCHTGHAFSMESLLAEVDEAVDTGLWETVRALEERVMLLEEMSKSAKALGHQAAADRSTALASETHRRIAQLREMVLDSALFAHAPPEPEA